ncbi:hypothetical protein [Natrinema caseinilyticum]|nr:hypothetical protein [Natrinema caseinilyticum]
MALISVVQTAIDKSGNLEVFCRRVLEGFPAGLAEESTVGYTCSPSNQ